jgi:hypothetical protein
MDMRLHFELDLANSGSVLSDSAVNCCGIFHCRTTIHNLEIAHQILDDACEQMHRNICGCMNWVYYFPQMTQKSDSFVQP